MILLSYFIDLTQCNFPDLHFLSILLTQFKLISNLQRFLWQPYFWFPDFKLFGIFITFLELSYTNLPKTHHLFNPDFVFY